jgi:DNA repair protein RadC
MMDALHQAVRGARVRRGFWSPRTCVRYVNGEGFVIEDIANPGLFTPFDPFSHDINATDWEILSDDAPPSGADSLDSVGVAEATVTPLRTAKTTRLGERVIQHGADTLDPHETLELYISRTRPKDAGRLADVLLGRFGDLLHVLGASVSELTQVVDTPIALDLKLLHDIAGRLLLMPIKRRNVIASWSTLLTYLRVQMAGSSVETFRGLFLDTRNQLIADEVLGYGTVSHAPVYPREIIKRALQLGASSVILSHQHPSGDPTPSRPDIEITKQVIDAGKPLGITVYDHIIVGTERTESMKALGLI